MSTSPPPSPTLQEQLKTKREQMRLPAPKIVEGRKSQRRSAIEMLEKADKLRSLGKGGRKSRKLRKTRRRLTRRR